jgi:hypothetical protein
VFSNKSVSDLQAGLTYKMRMSETHVYIYIPIYVYTLMCVIPGLRVDVKVQGAECKVVERYYVENQVVEHMYV